MKICKTCKTERPLQEFRRYSKHRAGLKPNCIYCLRSANRSYYNNNTLKCNEACKRHYKQNPEYYKNKDLKKKFGISLEEWNQMFANQQGRCLICNIHSDDLYKSLAVDHCHSTGAIRGLLCEPCNLAIGLLKENINSLKGAINYLTIKPTKDGTHGKYSK